MYICFALHTTLRVFPSKLARRSEITFLKSDRTGGGDGAKSTICIVSLVFVYRTAEKTPAHKMLRQALLVSFATVTVASPPPLSRDHVD